MKRLIIFLVAILCSFAMIAQDSLIISEVADPQDNAQARFVELFNTSHSPIDLSAGQYYICRQSDGTTWAEIPLQGIIGSGNTYVIAFDSTKFHEAFGFYPDLDNANIDGNGNDGYFLYKNGSVSTGGTLVDAYGKIDQNGAGQPWEYGDGDAFRNKDVALSDTTWTSSEWTITRPAGTGEMSPGHHECNYPANPPTKLAIVSISHNPTYYGWEFDVTVQARDESSLPGDVSTDTQIRLNSNGSANLNNNVGVIKAGTNTVTITGVTYMAVDTFDMTASVVSGDPLTTSLPETMVIQDLPTIQLSYDPRRNLIFDRDPGVSLHTFGFYRYTISGEKWNKTSSGGDYFLEVSNSPSGQATESWVIPPRFTNTDNPIGSFSCASLAKASTSEFKTMASTDYPGYGNPNNYTWTDISFNLPVGNFVWNKSGDLSFASFEPEYYIAFVFIEPAGHINTIRIDTLLMYNAGTSTEIHNNNSAQFTIYPNPVSAVLYVNAAQGTLQILDNTGRILKTRLVYGHANINVADLRPGIYFAKLNNKGQTQVYKFIKH